MFFEGYPFADAGGKGLGLKKESRKKVFAASGELLGLHLQEEG